jgi:hypothetical protein
VPGVRWRQRPQDTPRRVTYLPGGETRAIHNATGSASPGRRPSSRWPRGSARDAAAIRAGTPNRGHAGRDSAAALCAADSVITPVPQFRPADVKS